MTVTVLPKPWSLRQGTVREYVHTPGATTHVVLYESDLAGLNTASSSIGAFTMSLTAVAQDQPDLLSFGVPPDDADPANTRASTEPFRELVDLMLLAERGRLAASPLIFEGAFAPSLLRLVTQERLLQRVESLLFRARPRYAERTETLDMPRGRLTARSLLLSAASGIPRVESTFDELTLDTLLLQVVASALRVVASERLPRKIAVLRPSLQSRAVHLLRFMSGVRLVDRERALQTAERLWLNPLDRIWGPAIDAALPVLRDHAVVPEEGTDSSEAFLVHISTEKFWEQCLELALGGAFATLATSRDSQLGEGVIVPPPWRLLTDAESETTARAGKAFPDFMFRTSRRVVVADAKYKLAAAGMPSSQDSYQLFAYSHLATLNEQTSDFALILYPTRADGHPRQVEFQRIPDQRYPLWLVWLPFPSRTDLQSQASWSTFLARLVRTLRDFSVDWVVPPA